MSTFVMRLQQMLRGEVPPPVPPIGETLGFSLSEAGEGRAVFVLTARMDRHANPMGTLHGGVLCDVADAAMGTAYATLLEDGESFTTLELKINSSVPSGTRRSPQAAASSSAAGPSGWPSVTSPTRRDAWLRAPAAPA